MFYWVVLSIPLGAQCEGTEGSIEGLPETICQSSSPILISGYPADPSGIFTADSPEALTDHGDATASFDPSLAPFGQQIITYAWFDPQTGCQGTWSDTIWINDCPEPMISIPDGCTCREADSGDGGNATNLINGQFRETVLVEGEPGQTWWIASVDGFHLLSSPHPPAVPIPHQPGNPLLEIGNGNYVLKGVHVDGVGYTVTVTNGTDSLSISNLCTYPEPVMDPLMAGLCEESAPMALNGNGNGSDGFGAFSIQDAATGNILIPNATTFDPTILGIGDYAVEYVFDAQPDMAPCMNCAPGCVQAIQAPVSVTESPGALTCNDFILIALDDDCSQVIDPDLILEGSYPDYSIFDVHIFNGINDLGNTVGAGMLNQSFQVQITNVCNDNSCWGQIAVVDKWKPVINCPDAPIQVVCLADPAGVLPPFVSDNCDSPLAPVLALETVVDFSCDDPSGLLQRIERKWTAVDNSGNEAIPCLQVIEVLQPELSAVSFPPNLDGPLALDCLDQDTGPEFTGFPELDGYPLEPGSNNCELNVVYEDVLFEDCGNTVKILRKWTLLNWCNPEEVLNYNQIIHLADELPPDLECPDSLVVPVTSPGCIADFTLPQVVVTDHCSASELFFYGPDNDIHEAGDFISGLPAGDYSLQLLAMDECGNSTSCLTTLSVTDQSAPVAICDEITNVSLDAVGLAYLPASDLDDGSYDFCTEVSFSARRMDSVGSFTPGVEFDCSDVGAGLIQVQLQVTDSNGNSNECMVLVEVEDKLPPELDCPADTEVSCAGDLSDPAQVGEPQVSDNCSFELEMSESGDLDDCGLGSWTRSFFVTDPTGNTASCTQSITVFDPVPFSENDILWPEDLELSECDSMPQFHPDSLPVEPVNYGYPQFLDNECTLTGISYEDAFFDIADPACFKIVRTWSVIDWCQFDPINETGIWTFTQTLKVVDNDPPDVFCAFDPFVKILSPFCYDTVTLEYPIVTDCSPEIEVIVTSDLGTGFGPFPDVPMGNYDVMYEVTDQCGNSTYCSFTLQVVDAKNPTPVCHNGLVAEIGMDGTIDVPISLINLGSYDNCTAPEDLFIGYSWQFSDTVRTYTCADIGPQPVTMWVMDEGFNFDFCEVTIFIQDNLGHCTGNPVSIAGQIFTPDDEPVSEVMMDLNAGQQALVNEQDGSYYFGGLASGDDYTVDPTRDTDPLNGVTTYDALLISLHILGLQPIDTPYKLIAADVNNSGTITTLDALEIRKLVLQLSDGFTNNESWRFVDAAYEFSNPANPFLEPFPELLSFNNLDADISDADFIGIKIGDIDGSAVPSLGAGGNPPANRMQAVWLLQDQVFGPGQMVRTSLISANDPSPGSWQQQLSWAEDKLSLVSIRPLGTLSAGYRTDAGTVFLAGYTTDASMGPLYELEWIAQEYGRLSEEIKLEETSGTEARTIDGNHLELSLRFETTGLPVQLVYPNPGSGPVWLDLSGFANGPVQLKVLDPAGRTCWEQSFDVEQVRGRFQIPALAFPDVGLYYLQITSSAVSLSEPIIRQ